MPDIIRETPMEFFHAALTDALAHENVRVTPLSEFYVVRLLAGEKVQNSHPTDSLHDLFAQAIAETPARRDEMFRDVGDRALLISGLWWEHDLRPRRAPKSAALMQLGSSAYWTIGAEPFEELSQKFEGVVFALARLGVDATICSTRDLLRLYDAWERTKSPLAARVLAHRGLIAHETTATPS